MVWKSGNETKPEPKALVLVIFSSIFINICAKITEIGRIKKILV